MINPQNIGTIKVYHITTQIKLRSSSEYYRPTKYGDKGKHPQHKKMQCPNYIL